MFLVKNNEKESHTGTTLESWIKSTYFLRNNPKKVGITERKNTKNVEEMNTIQVLPFDACCLA